MEGYIQVIANIILISFVIVFLLFAYTFIKENEKRAAFISVIIASLLSLLILFFTFAFSSSEIPYIVIISITLIVSLVFIIPLKNKIKTKPGVVRTPFDERDIMFSRMELKEGTTKFEEYYKNNPDKKILDDKFRLKPGLLSKDSTEYHKYKFASTDANFDTVNSFIPIIDEIKTKEQQKIEPKELTNYINKWLKQIGAINVGITELKAHHLYSIKGRGKHYGEPITNKHKFAIAFIVEMDKDMIDTAPKAETIMESSQQYLEAAKIAAQLTHFIRNLGYSAKPHFDGNYDLICPVVAKDAGLGEFGRMGLLMTPELGPRVRIAVVTTNIPLNTNKYKYEPSIADFCTICKKCADNCPSNAISFDKMKDEAGVMRWIINHEACFTYWNITGTDCGKCIQVCPFSHPSNTMHNFIRKGIKNSYLFGQVALQMDDLFYGRKPNIKINRTL